MKLEFLLPMVVFFNYKSMIQGFPFINIFDMIFLRFDHFEMSALVTRLAVYNVHLVKRIKKYKIIKKILIDKKLLDYMQDSFVVRNCM